MSNPDTEKGKKQLILRLAPSLHRELASWAQEDFRSLNGQIEFLLTEALRRRKRGKGQSQSVAEDTEG